MKKLCALLLAIVISVCFSTVSFAAEARTKDNSVVQDTQRLPHKELSPQKLEEFTTRAAGPTDGKFVANCYLNRATSDSYWNPDYTTRWAIDQISVTFRAYSWGKLVCDETDTQYNASHAAAGRSGGASDESIGQHYFEEAGYESWRVETYYE